MTVLGHWTLVVALVTAVGSVLAYALAARGRERASATAGLLFRFSASAVVVASAVLLTLLLQHDFTNAYVYSYSDRSLPLHFLLSSFYAGQEGSFLFWSLCSSALGLVLIGWSRSRGSDHRVMTVFAAVHASLLILLLARSPFTYLWEKFADVPPGTLPPDGSGLNPLLQNFWMVIHPPVLFVGFAAMAVPFSIAVAGLWKREQTLLVRQGLPWVVFAAGVLGLGIMLGGYWAYGVLGWGGYWGWDPVENSSLVPWLTSMALIHTLLAQLRTGKYARANHFLAIASFFLVIYSTFLTRSGVLGDASVHSFADSGAAVYWLLLVLLAAIALGGFGLLLARVRSMRGGEGESGWLSREVALAAGAIALVVLAAVVLFGTTLPIFSTTRVEPSFYDSTGLPITIVMGILIALSLYGQWETQDAAEFARRSWKALAAAVLMAAVLVAAGVRDAGMAALAFSAFFALAVNVDVGVRIARGDWRFLGGKIAHIGVAVFLLGVIGSGRYSSSEQLGLPLQQPTEALGYTFTYTGARPTPDGKTAYAVRAERDGSVRELLPVMFEAGRQGTMKNPDITSFLTHDVYLSPQALEKVPGGGSGDAVTLPKGEAVAVGQAKVTFVQFDMGAGHQGGTAAGAGGMAVGAVLEIESGGQRETVTPVTVYRNPAEPAYETAQSRLLGAEVRLLRMSVGMGGGPSAVDVEIRRAGGGTSPAEVLVVEASLKPFIALVWGGTVLMMVGFVLALVKRSKEA